MKHTILLAAFVGTVYFAFHTAVPAIARLTKSLAESAPAQQLAAWNEAKPKPAAFQLASGPRLLAARPVQQLADIGPLQAGVGAATAAEAVEAAVLAPPAFCDLVLVEYYPDQQ